VRRATLQEETQYRARALAELTLAGFAALLKPLVPVLADAVEVVASHGPPASPVEVHPDRTTRAALGTARAHVREGWQGGNVARL
jgi:hypothetical protein